MPTTIAAEPNEVTDAGPEVFLDPTTSLFLAGRGTIFHHFLTLLTQDVQRERLAAARIEVRGTIDPEEDYDPTSGPAPVPEPQVREYQRAFGRRVDEWITGLSDEQRDFFTTNISFQARCV